jgi:hypothetical protein
MIAAAAGMLPPFISPALPTRCGLRASERARSFPGTCGEQGGIQRRAATQHADESNTQGTADSADKSSFLTRQEINRSTGSLRADLLAAPARREDRRSSRRLIWHGGVRRGAPWRWKGMAAATRSGREEEEVEDDARGGVRVGERETTSLTCKRTQDFLSFNWIRVKPTASKIVAF